jgi:hypothetical protein
MSQMFHIYNLLPENMVDSLPKPVPAKEKNILVRFFIQENQHSEKSLKSKNLRTS